MANAVRFEIDGVEYEKLLEKRDRNHPFSSGKIGYGCYGKLVLKNGDELQISLSLVVPHSEPTA